MNKLIRNTSYFFSGILFLLLAKIRNAACGYTPRTFSDDDNERSTLYDIDIVDNWIKELAYYLKTDKTTFLQDKKILELGPGADFGVGLYLLSKSAAKYTAIDINDNAINSSSAFYDFFFKLLREKKKVDTASIESEYQKLKNKEESKLNFVLDKDFNIVRALNGDTVDFVLSNAAFEHFADVEDTIKSISKVSAKGAIFLAIVDLKTHSRWIRDKDPNNIYRYPQWLYKILSNESTPNRVRPYVYETLLRENGWGNIIVKEGQTISKEQLEDVNDYLNKKYRNPKNQMNSLTCTIYATKL